MGKAKGIKHHVEIKLEDLNKMFQGGESIPVPKAFARSIQYLLSEHKVSIVEARKVAPTTTVVEQVETTATATEDRDESPIQFSISE